MKLFKALLSLVIIFGSAAYVVTHLYYYPCDKPVTYRLGTIDSRFNLSREAATADIRDAAQLWNTAAAKTLIQSGSDTGLTVNFIYDSRQGLASQINSAENKTTADKAVLDKRIAAFNIQVSDFKKQAQALNTQIADWNSHGGAPPDVFNQLQAQIRDLETKSQKLQAEAAALNQSTASFNSQIADLNTSITSLNALLSQKPEEGLFDSEKQVIEIYLVNTKSELIHTLAHELGHSLGIGHVEDPKAIMYTFTSQSQSLTSEDTSALTLACQKINRITFLSQSVNNLIEILANRQPNL